MMYSGNGVFRTALYFGLIYTGLQPLLNESK